MENKKNPEFDIDKNRTFFFFIGLLSSLLLVITAFEWGSVEPKRLVDLKKAQIQEQARLILEEYKKDSIANFHSEKELMVVRIE